MVRSARSTHAVGPWHAGHGFGPAGRPRRRLPRGRAGGERRGGPRRRRSLDRRMGGAGGWPPGGEELGKELRHSSRVTAAARPSPASHSRPAALRSGRLPWRARGPRHGDAAPYTARATRHVRRGAAFPNAGRAAAGRQPASRRGVHWPDALPHHRDSGRSAEGGADTALVRPTRDAMTWLLTTLQLTARYLLHAFTAPLGLLPR